MPRRRPNPAHPTVIRASKAYGRQDGTLAGYHTSTRGNYSGKRPSLEIDWEPHYLAYARVVQALGYPLSDAQKKRLADA